MESRLHIKTVAVIGAGPVGMAAAAHLLAQGLAPVVFESGATVGANLHSYRHVRLFSPWRYNLDSLATALLKRHGWRDPDLNALPTAGEFLAQYLEPLAMLPELAGCIKLQHRVLAITRAGADKVNTGGREHRPFLIRVQAPAGEQEFTADAILDASGTWSTPNPLGANGLPALGEAQLRHRIAYGMPDVLGVLRARYTGRKTLVVGAGHSAAGTLLALVDLAEQEPGTQVVWSFRGTQLARVFGGGQADGLPARGKLGARLKALEAQGRLELHKNFRIHELREEGARMAAIAEGGAVIADIDHIVAATGARPDLGITRELRVRHDPWLESTDALAPLIDPNEHSCGTVRPHGHRELAHPERGYYAVGAKSYGRAPNFLMATGYEQVRSVVAALTGDLAAADDVRLELPETGVCSTQLVPEAPPSAGCCGGRAPAGADACCALDADIKSAGRAGCGCGSADAAAPATSRGCCA
jgi:thioredoxin reductase